MYNHQEQLRLGSYEYAQKARFKPAVSVTSRRSAKHTSTNKVYADSRVIPQCGLETQLNKPTWIKEKQLNQMQRY